MNANHDFIMNVASVCHEANRQYCITLGDHSQPSWLDAPDWQRDSAMNGVMFHMQNPDRTPEDSHINWMKQKLDEGWIYGDTKDAEKKTHPCMMPYQDLPVSQQVKDHIFRGIVHAFLQRS